MAISDEKIREKKGIVLYPGMAGMTRDIIEKLKKDGAELLSVDIMVTQKCNFKCSYCYANSAPGDLPEFTMTEAKDIVQQCIKLKVPIINIQGGEPFFWHPKDWTGHRGSAIYHFIQYIYDEYKKAKLPLDLVSFTNVSLIDETGAKILYKLGVGLCCKLDSLVPEVQDELLCTKGGFNLMSKGYTNLVKAGYGKPGSPTISTNTVVTPQNYDYVEILYKWSRSNGFRPFVIPVHVHGRLQKEGAKEMGLDRTTIKGKKNLSPLDIKELFEKLAMIDREEFDIQWYPQMPWIENKACSRHLGGIHIRADGIVVPCSEAPDHWALGDIRKQKLKDIIKNPIITRFRCIYDNLHKESKCSPNNCDMSAKGLCYGCRTWSYDDSAFDDKGNYDINNLDPEKFFDGDPACWRGVKKGGK
jgi:radical SAM protein with 4Fe4S-binding SPASM domain